MQDTQSTDSVGSYGKPTVAQGCSSLDVNVVLEDNNIKFQRVWELTDESGSDVLAYGPADEMLQQSRRAKIAKYVAVTSEVRMYIVNCPAFCPIQSRSEYMRHPFIFWGGTKKKVDHRPSIILQRMLY